MLLGDDDDDDEDDDEVEFTDKLLLVVFLHDGAVVDAAVAVAAVDVVVLVETTATLARWDPTLVTRCIAVMICACFSLCGSLLLRPLSVVE